ncbi:VOC family protein [Clostridium sp. LY3-2]|uniref:VOC family protein n=1 Tax=Clostridium sp. LY3-2 TaxID=2942482 RepID=UPI002152D29E|nr:VOC family protein [Clostridium sp. LY3-2]MCR6514407.1 VOC family protein [Clostridium sp. LY3-2]
MDFKIVNHFYIKNSNYKETKDFYTNILGFNVFNESFDKANNKYILKLKYNDNFLELISYDDENNELDGLALSKLQLEVKSLNSTISELKSKGIETYDIKEDPLTKKNFTYFKGPDDLLVKVYQKSLIDVFLNDIYI